jgi:polysaccharide pyruvyl transferase WcaK-like protein
MKIALADGGSPHNKGDAAIYHGIIKMVKEACPSEELIYFSDHPNLAKKEYAIDKCHYSKYACDYKGFSNWLPHNKLKLLWRAIRTKLWFWTNWNWLLYEQEKETFNALKNCDVYISSGGSIINDYYWSTLYYNLMWWNYLRKKGKKVIILAHSVDPIKTLPYKNYLRKTLDKVDLIAIRENLSHDYLKDLGCNLKNVRQAGDAAFLFDFKDGKSALDVKKPAIAISSRFWKWFEGKQQEVYKQALIDIAKYLNHEGGGYNIYFISTGWDEQLNDLEFANTLRPRINVQTYALGKEPSAKELAKTLAQFDLMIGTRMHSTILSMLNYVPCVGTLYEDKTRGVFQSLGLGNYVLDIKTLTFETLKEKVDMALANRENIITLLKKSIPREREKAKLNIKYLKEVLYGE